MSKKNNKISIMYHGNCSDGFASAYVLKKRFEYLPEEDIEFIPVHHGDPVPSLKGKDVYILDFSYPREDIIELSKHVDHITVLDHHKTSENDLKDIEKELHCDSDITFDMSRAGCQLAWDFCFPKTKRPLVLDHIADRDLNLFSHPDTKSVSSYVYGVAHCFTSWDWLMRHSNYDHILEEGKILFQKTMDEVHRVYTETASLVTISGHQVLVAEAPEMLASDVCIHMLENDPEIDFSASYRKMPNGDYRFSLRSQDHREDVRIVAETFGGGGHRNASGFGVENLPWEDSPEISSLLNSEENPPKNEINTCRGTL